MTSFSRCATPSPVPRSGQITPSIIPISDYLEPKPNRLTIDFVTNTPKLKKTDTSNSGSQGPASLTTQADDSPYASLLAELEQSLIEKKMQTSFSPDNTSLAASTDKYCSSSKSSSKDLEFSKELEAALQLIQELETPSEGPFLDHIVPHAQLHRSDSEKTLSAAVSLPSPEALPFITFSAKSNGGAAGTTGGGMTPNVSAAAITTKLTIDIHSPNATHGKHILNVVCNDVSSQSTSGYSSPNSSNLNSFREYDSFDTVDNQQRISAISTASTIPTYIKTLDMPNCRQPVDTFSSPISLTKSNNSVNKSFLLFKKRSKLMPQADFQNRILKSECLAYLTEEELIARHQLNRNIIRVRFIIFLNFFLCFANG